jgi:hypothetical protein
MKQHKALTRCGCLNFDFLASRIVSLNTLSLQNASLKYSGIVLKMDQDTTLPPPLTCLVLVQVVKNIFSDLPADHLEPLGKGLNYSTIWMWL